MFRLSAVLCYFASFLIALCHAQRFEPFQDPIYGEFGLVDLDSPLHPHSACLTLKFHARLYNYNLNNTPISAIDIADFTSHQVRLNGYCALSNEVKKTAQLHASWKSPGGRKRLMKFKFREGQLQEGRRHEQQETRWVLEEVVYSEQYRGQSVTFSSLSPPYMSQLNASYSPPPPAIHAPLNQKFVCKDRLNISLHNPKYRRTVLELLPEIDVQPMAPASGFGSNSMAVLVGALVASGCMSLFSIPL